MIRLETIRDFPRALLDSLEKTHGIYTAEAFYHHVARDARGLSAAVHRPEAELQGLARILEGHLPNDFLQRCRQSTGAPYRTRGVIIDPPFPPGWKRPI